MEQTFRRLTVSDASRFAESKTPALHSPSAHVEQARDDGVLVHLVINVKTGHGVYRSTAEKEINSAQRVCYTVSSGRYGCCSLNIFDSRYERSDGILIKKCVSETLRGLWMGRKGSILST